MIKYTDQGKGDVILMLHGWGSNLETFSNLSNYFSDKYRVICVDLPGFGGSEKPADDWFVGDYADFINDFLKKIKVNNLYALIGHSFGGRIAIKSVANDILKPKKLILIGAAGIKHSDSIRSKSFKFAAKTGKMIFKLPLLNKFYKTAQTKLYKSAGSADYLNSSEMKQIFLNTINEDLQNYASKINIPSLLIWGKNDNESPVNDAKVFNKLINNSKLIIVPNAGHFVHNDDFEKVKTEIEKFL